MAADNRNKNYPSSVSLKPKKTFLENLTQDLYWLYANITKHHARKSLHHCNIVGCIVYASIVRGYPPMLPRDVYPNRKALRPQIFQSVTSVAATEKCCRLNICRTLRRWLLGPRDYLFLHARGKPRTHQQKYLSGCVSARRATKRDTSIQSIKRSKRKKSINHR